MKKMLFGLTLVIIVALAAVWFYPREKPPLKVGVALTLSTASQAFVGRSMLNGLNMAVDEVNAAGGIKGRRVELLVKDDKNDLELTLKNDRELNAAGVVAIFGHGSSHLSMAALEAMAKINPSLLYINSVSSSSDLAGLDDQFIRNYYHGEQNGPLFVYFAQKYLPGKKTIALIYSSQFPAISESLRGAMDAEWRQAGGRVSAQVGINTEQEYDLLAAARQALADDPEVVFIALPGNAAGMISQHLRRLKPSIELLVYSWAFTQPEFLESGGQAIEGAMGNTYFPPEPRTEKHRAYARAYQQRFDKPMSRADGLAYESMKTLLWAMAQTDDPTRYKDVILAQGRFNFLGSEVHYDAYGDCNRTIYWSVVKDGKLQYLGERPPFPDEEKKVE